MAAMQAESRIGALWQQRMDALREYDVVRDGNVFGAGLAGLWLRRRAKQKAQAIACMNNNRQLLLAWRQYSEDSRDVLPYGYALPPMAQYAWVPSGAPLDLDLASPTTQGNWDADNTIKKSLIWPYCGKSAGIWHCPIVSR